MKRGIKKIIHKIFNFCGYKIVKKGFSDVELDSENFNSIFVKCKKYTSTSREKIFALHQAVSYVVANNIEGDFVECGVANGGSVMVMAYSLLGLNKKDRNIYLYDTFEGMPKPTKYDYKREGDKGAAVKKWKKNQEGHYSNWCRYSAEDVRSNLNKTKYPADKIHFIKGKVENTIPKHLPEKISVLRLDTDFYESTLHELKYFYPLLSKGGILIIDDYGCWAGSKKAVDEYFAGKQVFLNRIDKSGRLIVKN